MRCVLLLKTRFTKFKALKTKQLEIVKAVAGPAEVL